jgi:hypothetical protein
VIDSTAIGIDALTVRLTLSARYTLDAAKTRPSRTPRTMAPRVNSRGASVAGTYGEKVVAGVVCWEGMVMREYELPRRRGARRLRREACGGTEEPVLVG